MAKEQDSAQGGGSNHVLYAVAAVIIGSLLFRFLYPILSRLWLFYQIHKWQLRFCGAVSIVIFSVFGLAWLWNQFVAFRSKRVVTEEDDSSVFLGFDLENGKKVHLKEDLRIAHTQVIGTTNAGKTASVILPWAVQDIQQGRGLIIIDGKAERGFLDKLYAHVVRNGRESDFKVFSLASPAISSTYNPFCDGTAEQIAERIFGALDITDPYYASIQFSALRTVLSLLIRRGERPMPGVVRELLRNRKRLQGWLVGLEDMNLAADIQALTNEKDEDFEKKYSGLVTALGHFSQGATARLYNTRAPEINILDLIRQKKICYFQLPTMQFPFLGEVTGKLILQSIQSAVSEIQSSGRIPDRLYSVYLDDFNDYIYPKFGSLLNKSRSANVGVVFSHQSLGDLEKVGPDFRQIVMTSTNVKIVMRSNDPESAEQFSKIIGTRTIEKTTSRRSKALIGSTDTGEQSVRETEEYIYHPNVFKAELGRGEGVVVIPHPKGRVVRKVAFAMVEDLPIMSFPIRDLPNIDLVYESTYRGKEVANVKSLSSGETTQSQSTDQGEKKAS